MRKNGKIGLEFRGKKMRAAPIAKRLQFLEERFAEIIRRVQQLEAHTEIGILDSIAPVPKAKPGRKPKLPLEEILRRRNGLIQILESNWPKLERHVIKAKRSEQIQDEKIRPILAAYLEQNPEHSGRLAFKGLGSLLAKKPLRWRPSDTTMRSFREDGEKANKHTNRLPSRVLANALAGAPEYPARTSYDKCSKHPSRMTVDLNIWIHYSKKYPYRCPLPIWEEQLIRRRDALVAMIEGNWPALLPLIKQIRDGSFTEKRKALKMLQQMLYDISWKDQELSRLRESCHLRKIITGLKRFLKTHPIQLDCLPNEFLDINPSDRNLPEKMMNLPSRQIANAIAGLPELTCQRSFDVCRGKPVAIPLPKELLNFRLDSEVDCERRFEREPFLPE